MPAPSANGCIGHTKQVSPARGDISNPNHGDGGYFFKTDHDQTDPYGDRVCIGSVRMWVHYTSRATKTWRVHVGSSVVASKTFTLGPGYYYWDFSVHREFWDPTSVCLGATNTPGYSCRYYSYLS
jgi:hypothetical protein